jgi:hypothetical protein
MRRALGAVLIALLVVGCGESAPGGGGGGNVTGDLPPLSVVWFGSAFDPSTFALTDKTASVKQGSPLVAVAKLFAPRPAEEVQVWISTGGSVRQRLPIAPGPTGTIEAAGADLTSLNLGPATYIVSFVDKKGTILASGNLNVTP